MMHVLTRNVTNVRVTGVACIVSSWNLGPNDVCLNMMPLFHIGMYILPPSFFFFSLYRSFTSAPLNNS